MTTDVRKAKPLGIWGATYRLIQYRPGLYLLNVLIWSTINIIPLLPGLVARQILNQISGNAAVDWNMWVLLALIVGIGIGRFSIMFVGMFVYIPFRFHLRGTLILNLMKHILKRPGAAALNDSPGEAVSRFRGDTDRLMMFVSDWMVDFIGFSIAAFIGLVVLFRINPVTTLTILIPLIVVITVTNLMQNRLEYYREAQRKATGQVTGFIGEMYGSIQAVKVANAISSVSRHFTELNETRRKAALKDSLFSQLLQTSFRSTIEVSVGIILLVAGRDIRSGAFTVGDFVLFISYLWPVTDGLTYLGQLLAVQKQTSVSVSRMEALLESSPDEALVERINVNLDGRFETISETKKSPSDRLLSLDVYDLTYTHPHSHRGVNGIDLSLKRGSFTVITGRVGSGKTTLLRVLLGLLPKHRGQILWNGIVVEDPSNFFIPPRCAYTGQVPRLFSDTLINNIRLGLPVNSLDIPRSIHAAVLERDLDELENHLDTLVGPRGVKLSGGQMHRTAAARMFSRRPELYVFDDLSSTLDVDTEATLWNRLFDYRQRENAAEDDEVSTCLVVSHRHGALKRADHIIVLKDGKIEAQGKLDDLLKNSVEFQRLWRGDIGQAHTG